VFFGWVGFVRDGMGWLGNDGNGGVVKAREGKGREVRGRKGKRWRRRERRGKKEREGKEGKERQGREGKEKTRQVKKNTMRKKISDKKKCKGLNMTNTRTYATTKILTLLYTHTNMHTRLTFISKSLHIQTHFPPLPSVNPFPHIHTHTVINHTKDLNIHTHIYTFSCPVQAGRAWEKDGESIVISRP
jgi:hypothetical protein